MLDIAIKYENELKEKFQDTWFQDKYKFYNFDTYYEKLEVANTTWNKHQFVSLNQDGEVIGYIGYGVRRHLDYCDGFAAINFSNDKTTFGIDLGRAVCDIFEKFNFNKLKFSVVIGNPIEKPYDKIIQHYNGRIVGIDRDEIRLIDGKLYDVKRYEIMRDDYLSAIREREARIG